jgi:hypothetical protein
MSKRYIFGTLYRCHKQWITHCVLSDFFNASTRNNSYLSAILVLVFTIYLNMSDQYSSVVDIELIVFSGKDRNRVNNKKGLFCFSLDSV